MRNFEKIDENSLRAFYFAAESLNFTRAAEAAALTQSGVSQHVARLEESLGASLFLRVGRKVQLTEAGSILKRFAEEYLDHVDSLLEQVRMEEQELKGLVRYAMPSSCLKTPHFPILLKAREKFSGVDLKVTICHSPEVVDHLLEGSVDFGFVTERPTHQSIEYKKFARHNTTAAASTGRVSHVNSSTSVDHLCKINYFMVMNTCVIVSMSGQLYKKHLRKTHDFIALKIL